MKANKVGASSPQRENKDASKRGQYTPSPPPARPANGSRSEVRSGLRRALSRQASDCAAGDERLSSATLSRYSILPAIGSGATSLGPQQQLTEQTAQSLSSSYFANNAARRTGAVQERRPLRGRAAESEELDGGHELEARAVQPASRGSEADSLRLAKPAFGCDTSADSRTVPTLERERAVLSATAVGTSAAASNGGGTSHPSGGNGAAATVRLAVKLPDGRKVDHTFDSSTTLQRVVEHVATTMSCDLTDFALVAWSAAPKTSFRDFGLTISEAGIQDRTLLYLEPP